MLILVASKFFSFAYGVEITENLRQALAFASGAEFIMGTIGLFFLITDRRNNGK